MIDVRMRHVGDARSVHFATVEFDQLDSLIPTLQAWGGVLVRGVETEDMSAQIVLDETGAYFEILLGEDE